MSVERSELSVERFAPRGAVFLSYAREDTDAARRIADALRSQGLEVWFDQNELRGGDAWDQKIRKQINDCTLFLPIISQHTQGRSKGYFRLEWKLAVEQTHLMLEGVPFLAPIAIDDTPEAGAAVPIEFMRVQWTRLPGALPTPQFVEQIRRLLSRQSRSLVAGVADPGPASPRPATDAQPAGRALRARLFWIGGAATVTLLGAFGWMLSQRKTAGPSIAEPAARRSAPPTSEKPVTPAFAAKPPLDFASAKSIAVLAFKNLSDDKDTEYFSDGISEELSNVLGKVPGLRVAGSTSAFSFKGKPVPIQEIAQKLGVAYIVEGTVKKIGTRVRIMAKLVNAADGFQVWASDNLDRELKDIWAVQEEIAGLIARNLSLKLGASTPAGPVNPEVFRLYLEGRQEWNRRTEAGFAKAQTLFERAIALDPKFARAYSGLADVWVNRANRFPQDSDQVKEHYARAGELADRALGLDSNLAEALTTQAEILSRSRQYDAANAAFLHALALNPNYATAHHWFGLHLFGRGRIESGLAELAVATRLDPLSSVIAAAYGLSLNHARRWAESLAACDRALAIRSDYPVVLAGRALALIGLNRRPEALAILLPLVESTKSGESSWRPIAALAQAGDRTTAARLAGAVFADPAQTSPDRVFELYVALNRIEEGFAFLERNKTTALRSPGWFVQPVYDAVRDDPRFLRKLEEAGTLTEYRDAWAEYLAWKKKTGQP